MIKISCIKAVNIFLMPFIALFISILIVRQGEAISSKEGIEKAKELDKQKVIYSGEVVTAIMNRGEYSWININDKDNAIGVWCKTQELKDIKFLGGYKCKGDMVEVEGVFNGACPEHGGDLDIHADKIKILEKGRMLAEDMQWKRLRLAAYLFMLTLLVIGIFRKRI